MSQRVLFNGAVLIRPGAATKVDATGFANVVLSGLGVVGLIGEADGGEPQVIKTFRDAAAAQQYYRSGPLVEAAAIAFNPSADPRVPNGASLIACVKVNKSTQSFLALNGSGGVADVTGVTTSVTGTAGTTNYTYGVVAQTNGGFTKVTTANVTTGPATLSGTNYNVVTWTTLAGAQGYWIYRTASSGNPSTTGYIGAVAAGATSFNDIGLQGDGTPASAVNTTGTSVFVMSKDYGKHTNNVSVQVVAGNTSNGRMLVVKSVDNGILKTETSPSLGDSAKFTILYTGAGTGATMSITAGEGGTLATTVTGATADNLNLYLANFKSLADLVSSINASGKYIATTLVGNAGLFSPTNLDPMTTADIKTAPAPVYASKFDILNWLNQNSQYLEASAGGATGAPTIMAGPTYLSGGYRGVTNNTDFTKALALLTTLRVNQVCTLASSDGEMSENQGGNIAADSYTALAVAAATDAHAKFCSSISGKNERHAFVGLNLNKQAAITEATLLQSWDTTFVTQSITLPTSTDNFISGLPAGTFIQMPEWAAAVTLAGLRAGAPLGEPLTWKYVRAFGVTQTSDWTPKNDAEDLILNGVTVFENVAGKGIRIIKCITTYTRANNDAYTEESLVQGWKNIAYEWRTAIEDRYTGTRGLLSNVQTVVPFSNAILSRLRDQGQIADSYIDGAFIPGYREIRANLSGDVLSLSASVSPVPGINFILSTLYIVPAQISV